jgi:hypothetical protein
MTIDKKVISDAEIVRVARELFVTGTSNMSMDDFADVSRCDDGAWVQAWVWVSNRDLEDET